MYLFRFFTIRIETKAYCLYSSVPKCFFMTVHKIIFRFQNIHLISATEIFVKTQNIIFSLSYIQNFQNCKLQPTFLAKQLLLEILKIDPCANLSKFQNKMLIINLTIS